MALLVACCFGWLEVASFGGFDVRGREARIPTGDEVVFSQLEVAAEEDFGLAWGS